MIAALFLAQVGLARPTATPASTAALLTPANVLQRYAAALKNVKEPRVLTFDYTLDQTGTRTLAQTHRVFRSSGDERDETLTVDGKRLSPPKIRIFRGRRNRYAIGALAPRPADYDFRFVGSRKNGHHNDYVFRLTPHAPRPFAITGVTIDGVRFLPSELAFATQRNDGSGSIAFGRNAAWWVPYTATARATIANTVAAEKLSFYTYRFPTELPPSTFAQPRRLPETAPALTPLRATPIPAGPLPAAPIPDVPAVAPTPTVPPAGPPR